MAESLPVVEEERAERCETCRFWERNSGVDDESGGGCDNGGCCKRLPPTYCGPHEDNATRPMDWMLWSFPAVTSDDWCGEWKEKGTDPLCVDCGCPIPATGKGKPSRRIRCRKCQMRAYWANMPKEKRREKWAESKAKTRKKS